MSLTFRAKSAADASFLTGLSREAFAQYGDYAPVLEEWANDRRVDVTIAEQDGTKVGAALLLFLRPREAPDTAVADLLALAVAAPWRGRGLGAVLLRHVIGRAREAAPRHGASTLRLTVAETNIGARRLFESAGFRYDREDGSYPGGQKALHMSLPLGAGGSAAG